jgi:hypothetical protein
MHVDEGLRQMLREAGGAARSRHGMPLVPDSTGVEDERMRLVRGMDGRPLVYRHEARPAIRVREAAIFEEPRYGRPASKADRPLRGLEVVVLRFGEARETADVEESRGGLAHGEG